MLHLFTADIKEPADDTERVMRSLSGAFSFEFLYRTKQFEELKPEIKVVIDTFKISSHQASKP